MFWFFKKKKKGQELEEKFSNLHNSLHNSFSNIKKDINNMSSWVGHLKNKHDNHNKKFELLNYRINNIEEVLEDLRDVWTRVQTAVQTGGVSKQTQTDSRPNSCPEVSKQLSKQENRENKSGNSEKEITIIDSLRNLTMMERAVVWALLNTDLKLSYEDLSIALGKDKSTLRGQINNLKTKSEGLIEEYTEKDGKKRFYINEKKKNSILKGIGRKEKVAQKVKKRTK